MRRIINSCPCLIKNTENIVAYCSKTQETLRFVEFRVSTMLCRYNNNNNNNNNRTPQESATCFLHGLGRRISLVGGEDREPQFLFRRISVAIQRFNAVLLHDGFLVFQPPGLVLLQSLILFINFFPSSGIYLLRFKK